MEFGSRNMFHISSVTFFVVLSIATTTVSESSSNSECNFPAIFNFGDSNSDTGGLAASFVAPKPPNGETYFHRPNGRFSDGRLIVDFIGNVVFYFNIFLCTWLSFYVYKLRSSTSTYYKVGKFSWV